LCDLLPLTSDAAGDAYDALLEYADLLDGMKDDNRIDNLQLRQGPHGHGHVIVCGDCGSDRIRFAELENDEPVVLREDT
jgi:hypothetical protein